MSENVFAIETTEGMVGCYFCQQGGVISYYGDVDGYRRGEAVLAGAGHPPYDANAHYICLAHLDRDTVIADPENDFRHVSLADYSKLGRPEVIKDMHLRAA